VDIIPSALTRHEKIALNFSGGKDSLACVHLLREHLDRITIYHVDTGDKLPEQQESVARVEAFAPHFVRIQMDVRGWIAANGLPTDLMPHNSHVIGRLLREDNGPRLVPRYDCCYANIMLPAIRRAVEDGNTLIVRGTKTADIPRLPWKSGDVDPATGLELYLPLRDWSDADVFAFLRSEGVEISRFYQEGLKGAPDCAHCSAWWDEGRGPYLKKYHPEVFAEYERRLCVIAAELGGPLTHLHRELSV